MAWLLLLQRNTRREETDLRPSIFFCFSTQRRRRIEKENIFLVWCVCVCQIIKTCLLILPLSLSLSLPPTRVPHLPFRLLMMEEGTGKQTKQTNKQLAPLPPYRRPCPASACLTTPSNISSSSKVRIHLSHSFLLPFPTYHHHHTLGGAAHLNNKEKNSSLLFGQCWRRRGRAACLPALPAFRLPACLHTVREGGGVGQGWTLPASPPLKRAHSCTASHSSLLFLLTLSPYLSICLIPRNSPLPTCTHTHTPS